MRRFVSYRRYLVANSRFYEDIGQANLPFELEHDLRALARPSDEVAINGVWAMLRPSDVPALPAHGWKVHVSATPETARRALAVVGREYDRGPFFFKCLRDLQMVLNATSPAWPAGQVGKIITIYARSADECRSLLERLHPALEAESIAGPYILTDKRYQDSKSLYYRYGEFTRLGKVGADGVRTAVLTGPDGEEWADDRQPVYRKPPWVDDLFPPAPPSSTVDDQHVVNGYRVVRALQHSGVGGVYLAERLADGAQVLLKEARPRTGFAPDGSDRQDRLRREYAALTLLRGTGVAPEPYELFEAWEHLFLAEEYIEAVPLVSYLASRSPLVTSRPDPEVLRAYEAEKAVVLERLREAIRACHERGISYGDISLTNVFVRPDPLHVWLIDFESSQPLEGWAPTLPATPGFVPRPGSSALGDGREFDEFGLAAVELAMLFPRNLLRELDERALVRSTVHVASLLGKPPGDLADLFQRLQLPPWRPEPPLDLDTAVKEAVRFIENVMTVERSDRIFPADPAVFTTNPWSVAHGAAGVIRALHRITGGVPAALAEWVDRGEHLDGLPPGLCYGNAGVGWSLLEAGWPERGRELIDRALAAVPATGSTVDSSGLEEWRVDVATGSAGIGLAALAGWLHTADESYLRAAERIGESLIRTAADPGTGLHWPRPGGALNRNGYAYGPSGVATFLLYLSRAANDERFLRAGRRALNFDLTQLVERDDGGIWFPGHVASTIYEPYWEGGGSGLGSTVARYWIATGDERLRVTVDRLANSIVTGTAVNPGLFVGMAGITNFALDCHRLLGDAHYRDLGATMAQGILALASEQPEGLAFPGHGLLRLTTDYATGSAGIALVLDRLRSSDATHGAPDFNYSLDQLLG